MDKTLYVSIAPGVLVQALITTLTLGVIVVL